jgi:hypothetical protein
MTVYNALRHVFRVQLEEKSTSSLQVSRRISFDFFSFSQKAFVSTSREVLKKWEREERMLVGRLEEGMKEGNRAVVVAMCVRRVDSGREEQRRDSVIRRWMGKTVLECTGIFARDFFSWTEEYVYKLSTTENYT